MRLITAFFIVSMFFVSLAGAQSYSSEEQEIVDRTINQWKNFAERNYDAMVSGPGGLGRIAS